MSSNQTTDPHGIRIRRENGIQLKRIAFDANDQVTGDCGWMRKKSDSLQIRDEGRRPNKRLKLLLSSTRKFPEVKFLTNH